MPKILVISSLGLPPYLGGIENVIDTLIKSSLASTYDFKIFDTYRKPDPKRTIINKILFAITLPLRCGYYILKEKPDIVHIHFCSNVDFWKHSLCLFASNFLRCKTIFHLHGGTFDKVYNHYGSFKKLFVRYILQKPNILIALSKVWKDFLLSITSQKDIYIIPNPINCSNFSKATSKYRINDHKQILLLGSLGKRKGHFDVLKSMPDILSKYPNAHVYFAGIDEDFNATKKLKEIALKNNISKNVHFLGPIFGKAKFNLIRDSYIVILPSYGENMPISILEGMAAGKPVISTYVGGIPEMIVDQECGILINAGDWKSLSNNIISLLESPNLAATLGNAAQKKVLDKWDVKVIAKLYDSLYLKLMFHNQ